MHSIETTNTLGTSLTSMKQNTTENKAWQPVIDRDIRYQKEEEFIVSKLSSDLNWQTLSNGKVGKVGDFSSFHHLPFPPLPPAPSNKVHVVQWNPSIRTSLK